MPGVHAGGTPLRPASSRAYIGVGACTPGVHGRTWAYMGVAYIGVHWRTLAFIRRATQASPKMSGWCRPKKAGAKRECVKGAKRGGKKGGGKEGEKEREEEREKERRKEEEIQCKDGLLLVV